MAISSVTKGMEANLIGLTEVFGFLDIHSFFNHFTQRPPTNEGMILLNGNP